jgi:diamine N-acetyltransferase
MIDKAYQKQGMGSKALEKVLEYIRTYPCGPAAYCWLSCVLC